MEVGFGYGALCEPLETQANEQGLTLGVKAKSLEKNRHSFLNLRFSDLLPDSQYDKLLKKFHKKVIAACKVDKKAVDEPIKEK